MKKALKIVGWTLLGIVLVIVAVVTIACYVIFTPERLTPIARRAADTYLTCEHEIGEVELTFFSTFPRFGLRADRLLIINPKSGSQNDTVVSAGKLVATVDVMEFLSHRNLHVHEAILDSTFVNFYIAADGTTNLTDVFLTSPDTAAEDTSAFALPFNALRVDGLRVQADYVTFVDAKDTICASLGQTELTAQAESWDDMLIALDAHEVCASLQGDTYADRLHLELIAPMAMDLNTMHFAVDGARLAVNDFTMQLQGDVTIGDSIAVDAGLQTGKWQIKPLLALVPAKFAGALSDLDVDGEAALEATVRGYFSDHLMPRIQAHLALNNGEGRYIPLPYILRNVELDAIADLRLNEGERSNVAINSLKAQTRQSALAAKGKVYDILGNMLLDLAMDLDAYIPDFDYFLPDEMVLEGKAKGVAKAKIHLDDLTDMHLERGEISADLQLTDIHYDMNSIVADLPNTHAVLSMPNPKPSRPRLTWAQIDLTTDRLDLEMATPLQAKLQQSAIRLEAGNILSKDPVLYAGVDLRTEAPVTVVMDSMGAQIDAPKMRLYAEYNTRDTTVMPVAQLGLTCNAMDGYYADNNAQLQATELEASVSGGRKDKSAPRLKAKLRTTALQTRLGDELQAKTGRTAIDASASYKAGEQNIFLQWNPRLSVQLVDGEAVMPEHLPEPVRVPTIDFNYSNRAMHINSARVELGNSDLNIKGEVKNIGKWFRKQAVLEGVLDIVSDHCDANQLMDWFSADSGSEEIAQGDTGSSSAPQAGEPELPDTSAQPDETAPVDATALADTTAKPATQESEPFLVPVDVDLALNTHIRVVEFFTQTATDLKGGLFIKDGTMILDEMGFVCRAAKLQLTAMYRTPRRNHLYLGLDYHMLDVNIEELVTMIPPVQEMVPMIKSFKGAAEFHLAAETYLNSQYQPKMSTLRGAASLTGKDLVVLDGETFDKISRKLLFSKKTENRIDSLNAEMTVYKNEIDIYPLCVQMDNYMVALGGRHNTNMTFDYDINVLKPIYLGVKVNGNIDNLNIKLTKCKFAKDFRPHWYDKVDNQSLELRQRIKRSMEKNVRIK